jgi:Zn-dependent protease
MAEPERYRVQWSIPLVTIAHIQIRVHVTFFALLALVAWGASVEGGPGAFAGIGWILLLFACVVVHEFAHALVARSYGVEVHEILLLPIGGVSKMEEIPARWREEFAIAAAGPAASLLLGFAAGVVALAFGLRLFPVDLFDGAILVRLAWVNLILAGFNLLPAFPLDGGRILRSLLERRHDLLTATRWAARVGKGLAVVMMLVGALFDWWLILIGAFIFIAATGEERATLFHVRLAPLHVRDLAVVAPIAFGSDEPAGDTGRRALHALQVVFPIIDADGYVGACTVNENLAARPDARCETLVDPEIPTVHAGDSLEGAVATLIRDRAETAVVVDDGAVVGLFRLADVTRVLEGPAAPGQARRGPSNLVHTRNTGQTSAPGKD